MRIPCDIREQGVVLTNDETNFSSVLNYYTAENVYVSHVFEEKLKELLPRLSTTRVTPEFEKLVFRMGYAGKQFDLSDVSDGTLKAMLLTMLIFIPVNEGLSLLAIDKPEMNLHPVWQKIIGRWIQLSDNFKQCFISTHSPDFLDVFTDGFKQGMIGIYVFNDTESNIKKIIYSDIKNELDDWLLGDLYRNAEPLLGGWPW